LEGTTHPILIYTDHRSLVYLNTQPHLTAHEARWMERLSEFDFQVKHVPGKANVVADALSRRPDYGLQTEGAQQQAEQAPSHRVRVKLAAVTEAKPRQLWEIRRADIPLLADLQAAAKRDPVYQERVEAKRDDGLIVGDGLLWTCDGLVYVPDDLELQRRLIHEVHDTPTGGHMGLQKTLRRLWNICWWPGMKSRIADYVHGCTACAATKTSNQKPAGLLHPLPIPGKPWQHIGIDFVGPLPMTSDFFNSVLVVTDKFSKMAHFIPTTINVDAKQTARLLIDNVVKFHGLPEAIISDRGTQFIARLFQQVWDALGTDLRMSTSYHPQSDGQTERLIKELEHQLRTFANHMRGSWKDCLSVAEMHYNSDVHESTGKTPYEMNGVDWKDALALALQKPASKLSSEGAQQLLDSMKAAWEDARQVMLKRREQQKKYADRRRREERFQAGDLVMLSTENLSVGRGKLSDRYVGPFQVAEVRDNGVNVRLKLPKQFSRIHPVFHVEKLKRFLPSAINWPGRVQRVRPPPVIVDGQPQYWALRILGKKEEEIEEVVNVVPETNERGLNDVPPPAPESGLRRSPRGHALVPKPVPPKRIKKGKPVKVNRVVVLYLVEWEGYGTEAATWEKAEQLIRDGAQSLIDDYEKRQLEATNPVELVSMCLYEPRKVAGVVELACVSM